MLCEGRQEEVKEVNFTLQIFWTNCRSYELTFSGEKMNCHQYVLTLTETERTIKSAILNLFCILNYFTFCTFNYRA
jgi:hypothetical protein